MFRGVVVRGRGRGRAMGFPTANLAPSDASSAPNDGIYSCWVRLPPDPRPYGATISIGNNPTFDDVDGKLIEVFVHDFDGDLYGRTIDVHLAARLRDMSRFRTIPELITQTIDDVQRSRSVLALTEPPTTPTPES